MSKLNEFQGIQLSLSPQRPNLPKGKLTVAAVNHLLHCLPLVDDFGRVRHRPDNTETYQSAKHTEI